MSLRMMERVDLGDWPAVWTRRALNLSWALSSTSLVNMAPFSMTRTLSALVSTNSLLVRAGPIITPSGWSVRFMRRPSYPGTVYSIVRSPNMALLSSGKTLKSSLGLFRATSRSVIMLSDSCWPLNSMSLWPLAE